MRTAFGTDRPLVGGIGASAPPPKTVGGPAAGREGEAPIAGVDAIGFRGDELDEEDNRALLVVLGAKLSLLNLHHENEVTGFIVTEIMVS